MISFDSVLTCLKMVTRASFDNISGCSNSFGDSASSNCSDLSVIMMKGCLPQTSQDHSVHTPRLQYHTFILNNHYARNLLIIHMYMILDYNCNLKNINIIDAM